MLNVYTFRVPRPQNTIDLSMIPLSELADAVMDIYHHQTSANLWFGYLDGWMLTPHEEVLLRKAIRKFECTVVSFFPLSLSHAWQNEIRTIYTADPHGASSTHNNGSIVHDRSSSGHEQPDSQPAPERNDHQNRKARRPQARRVQKGQNPTPKHNSRSS